MASQATPPYEGIENYAAKYELPGLPFAQNGLEPHMDEATVKVHHTGHHAAYTNKLNVALEAWRNSEKGSELANKSILEIIRRVGEVPPQYIKAIRNNGGGYVNHNIFFACLGKSSGGADNQPTGTIADDINKAFVSFKEFKTKFTEQAAGVFGSGYAWLSRDESGALILTTTANQESAISAGLRPILVIDVWEHAYYLKYKNKRPDFISAWWEIVNWDAVAKLDKWWAGK